MTNSMRIIRHRPLRWSLTLLLSLTVMVAALLLHRPVSAEEIVVYKSPSCGCCGEWVKHLQENGFTVKSRNTNKMNAVKAHFGVPEGLHSCHTAKIGDYVIEGHVPASDIKRLLRDRPEAVSGLSAPGMPMGSPGMEGPRSDPYEVLTFSKDGSTKVYARHNQ